MTVIESPKLSIRRTTKGKLPRLPFVQLKDTILGKRYELSIAFVSPAESRAINLRMRGKDKPTNVLSFSLSEKSGEIILNLSEAAKGAKKFDRTKESFLGFLVIHGMLHLKGMEHGSTMEAEEKKFCAKFGF